MTVRQEKEVLVVDDDASIRHMIAAALARLGVPCDTAVDGADALHHVAAFSYSVILVDLMMPRVDGRAFVIEVRKTEKGLRERTVVLMMTAFPPREPEPELGDKIQAVIQKPFDVIELAEIIRDCVAAKRTHDPRPGDESRIAGSFPDG